MAAPSSGKVTVPSGRVIKIPVSRIPAGTMPVMTSSAGGTQILLNHSGHLSLAPSGHSGGHIVTIQKDSLLSSPARLAAEGQRISQAILSTTPGSQIRSAMITTTTPTTNVRAISSANVTPNSPAPPYTPQSIKQMNESSSRQREVLVTTSRPSSEMKKLTSEHKTMPLPSTVDRNKGLRHFSTKVCDKVKEKGATTYNEVADELVAEYFESSLHRTTTQEQQLYDQKNIRRRVYDALNVLMAMNIIAKEKKEIKWIGLPSNSAQECFTLEAEKRQRQERIKQKMEQLQDMIVQQVAFKNLVERNRENEKQNGKPSPNTLLYLPYIVINTEKKTVIDCSISYDKTEYLFNFDQPFEIHDDFEVLKRMGLSCGLDSGQTLPEEIPRLKQFLPPALRDYVDQIADGQLQFEDRPKAATQPQSQVGAMIVDTTQIVRTSRTPAGSSNGTQRNDLSSPPDAADMEVALTLRAVNTAGQQLAAKQSGLTDPQSSESQQQWFENQQPSTHK